VDKSTISEVARVPEEKEREPRILHVKTFDGDILELPEADAF
jgi:hypothetical protein